MTRAVSSSRPDGTSPLRVLGPDADWRAELHGGTIEARSAHVGSPPGDGVLADRVCSDSRLEFPCPRADRTGSGACTRIEYLEGDGRDGSVRLGYCGERAP